MPDEAREPWTPSCLLREGCDVRVSFRGAREGRVDVAAPGVGSRRLPRSGSGSGSGSRFRSFPCLVDSLPPGPSSLMLPREDFRQDETLSQLEAACSLVGAMVPRMGGLIDGWRTRVKGPFVGVGGREAPISNTPGCSTDTSVCGTCMIRTCRLPGGQGPYLEAENAGDLGL